MAPDTRRKLIVVMNVLLLHLGLLWAMQSGLLRKAVERVVPVQMLSEFIEPPAPKLVPPPPAPQLPVRQQVPKAAAVKPQPAPPTLAVVDNAPAPDARVAQAAMPTPPAPIAVPVGTATVAAPPRDELPSSDADYLQNPRPLYPPLSKRLGEQGQVVYSVLIGVDGLPQSARLVKSSGFDRLDQAALSAVMRWRYSPGKRNGVATAMSFNVPINWVLE